MNHRLTKDDRKYRQRRGVSFVEKVISGEEGITE